jgi:hypothetical protein
MRVHETPVRVVGRVFLSAQQTEILIAMQNFYGGHGGSPLSWTPHVDRARVGKHLHPSSAPGFNGTIDFSVAQNLCEI